MSQKWNLQDIRPAQPKKVKRGPAAPDPAQLERREHKTITNENDGTVSVQIDNQTGGKKNKPLFIALAVFVLIIASLLAASMLMAGAEVTVHPRYEEPNINAEFTAHKTPQPGQLGYEILTLEAESERQVEASGKEAVDTLAEGTITIFKTTPGAERLIKNTRFESPDGQVFRIKESAVVPGSVADGSGASLPGSIQAEVFADAAGEEYNLERTRFTVPGFKESGYDELYDAIYAENSTPFTGGFSGEKFIINDETLKTEKQALQVELRNQLLDRIDSERPAGFVLYDEAVTLVFYTLPAVAYGDNLATIKERAVMQIPIFAEEDFSNFLAEAAVPGYEQQPTKIEDPQVLSFSYTDATTSASNIANYNSIDFKLVGRPKIIWTYDKEQLKAELLGMSKTSLKSVLSGYPAIEKAEATIMPFYMRSFPQEMDDIEIIEIVSE